MVRSILIEMFIKLSSFILVVVGLSHAFPSSTNEEIGTRDSSAGDDSAKTKLLLDVIDDMEPAVNPCDDFFKYSCGNWLKKNPIPNSKSSYNRFVQLQEKTSNLLAEYLDQLPTTGVSNDDSMVKMKRFYDSCMSIDEPVGDIPHIVRIVIDNFGSWPIDKERFIAHKWSLLDTLKSVSQYLDIHPVYRMLVPPDLYDTTKRVMSIDQKEFLPNRAALTSTDEIYVKQRAAVLQFYRTMAKYFGATDETLHYVDQAFELFKELAQAALPVAEFMKYAKNYKLTSVEEIEKSSGMPYGWLGELLDGQIAEFGENIRMTTKISSISMDYVTKAYKIVSSKPKGVQATMIILSILTSIAGNLPMPYRSAHFQLYKKLQGINEEPPRKETCVATLKSKFMLAIGKLFVDNKLDQDTKDAVDEMTEGVRANLIKVLKATPWMDEKTKSAGVEKAETVNKNIGYPEIIKSKREMDTYYKKANPNKKNFFQNVLAMELFSRYTHRSKFGKPVDKTEWSTSPAESNAYYDVTSNRMIFPAGLFQSPFFRKGAPKSMNYGAIGAVVGHEIIHGFDSSGREFDKHGSLKSWWSDEAEAEFNKKTKCLIDQYSSFSMFNKTNKGEQTIMETTADNGGLKLILAAYEDYVKANGEETIPDGIQLTPRQLFFIANAQVWCSSHKRSAAIRDMDSGGHPLGEFRVSGIVQNSAEFARAFSCPKGSKMNPNRQRCAVW